jgi:hypothetical protein
MVLLDGIPKDQLGLPTNAATAAAGAIKIGNDTFYPPKACRYSFYI